MTEFAVGKIYYGTLACAHSDFPVRVTKRTEKTVWFEHANRPEHYAPRRSKIRNYGNESANFHGWYISADKTTGGDFDLMTI